jgi:hypothetical protein
MHSTDVHELGLEVGIVDTLKLSTFHGLTPSSRQTRATVSLPTPARAANERVVRWVELSASAPSGNHVPRPRPFAITPTWFMPRSTRACRHEHTVFDGPPPRRPISSFANPSAANNNALRLTDRPLRQRQRGHHRPQRLPLLVAQDQPRRRSTTHR